MIGRRGPLGVLFLTVFIDLLGFGIVIPILPTYAKQYGATALAVGLLGTIYSATQLLCAPLWGMLSDRVGRRPVILASAAGSAVAYAVFGAAASLPILFVARAIGGACGANISTAQAYIADVTTPEQRARGMAIIGAGFGLGFTIGPALGGLGTHFFGARAPFFIASGLAAVNVVWAWLALPEPERRVRRGGGLLSGLRGGGERPFWAYRTLTFFLVVFFVVTYAFSNIEATFALFNHARLEFGEKENGWIFMYIGLVLSAVQAFGTRRLVARFGERRLISAGTGLMAVGAALVTLVGGVPVLVAATTLIAAGSAINSPSIASMISRAAPPERQGEMLGLSQSVGALGRILGPAAGGFLFDLSRDHSWPYVAAAGLMACVAIAVGISAVRA